MLKIVVNNSMLEIILYYIYTNILEPEPNRQKKIMITDHITNIITNAETNFATEYLILEPPKERSRVEDNMKKFKIKIKVQKFAVL